jgi:transcriptional regulator with XRE-family HTH domain
VQISRVETGAANVSIATIAALAAALQVEVSQLFAVGATGEAVAPDAVRTDE